MKPKAWQVHIPGTRRHVQPAQDQPETLTVFRLDTRLAARFEEALKAFVLKALDRHGKECNLLGYGMQFGLRAREPDGGHVTAEARRLSAVAPAADYAQP